MTELFFALDWDDPYPAYHAMRRLGPVRLIRDDLAVATGYRAVSSLLRDPRAGNDLRTERGGLDEGQFDRYDSLLYRDAPDHPRLRRVIQAAVRLCAATENPGRHAHKLLNEVAHARRIDAAADLARPIGGLLAADLFGVPAADADRVLAWSRDVTLGLEPAMTPRQVRSRVLALDHLAEYLGRSFDEAGGALIRSCAEVSTGRADRDELVAAIMLMLSAVLGSTVDLLTSAVVALSRHPRQYELIRQDHALLDSAVEECLRYESPFQLTYRRAGTDLDVAGCHLPAGTRIALLLGAANRDPDAFAEPGPDVFDVTRFDVTRSGPQHLAFGFGPHSCLGIALARPWAHAVLAAVVERLPRLVPAGPVEPRPTRIFRGYATVPIRW